MNQTRRGFIKYIGKVLAVLGVAGTLGPQVLMGKELKGQVIDAVADQGDWVEGKVVRFDSIKDPQVTSVWPDDHIRKGMNQFLTKSIY